MRYVNFDASVLLEGKHKFVYSCPSCVAFICDTNAGSVMCL